MSRKKARNAPQVEETPRLKRPNLLELAMAQIHDKYSGYPSNGLTPERLAAIFREADAGDVLRQMELFEEMEEKDPHLFSQLQTRKNAVTGLDYEVIPFDPDNETDKVIAEFVKTELESLESVEDIMLDLLDAIGKGIAISEIIWGYHDGRTVVEDIKRRHQKRLIWDNQDNLKILTKDQPGGLLIPENKFIVHRYKARSGHPSRAGLLRVVAWMYLFKNYDIKDWVSFCEVFGMPMRLGKYDPSASEADKEALMRALVQLGSDAAGIIPNGTEIEFKESAKTTSINVYETLARYCDEQVSKAILGQTLTSDSGSGSYAQSKTHNEVRHDLTIADCKALAATLRRDLIRPLVLYNFGEERRIPYLRFDVEEAEDQKEMADVFETLICDIGLQIPTAYLYKKFGIPKPEPGEEIAQPQRAAVLPFKQVALKDKLTPAQAHQAKIDELSDRVIRHNSGAFAKMFRPVLKMLGKAQSLEEVQRVLESDELVAELFAAMDVSDFEELLQRAMLYSDLTGRTLEQ